jgi:hypothetical protein
VVAQEGLAFEVMDLLWLFFFCLAPAYNWLQIYGKSDRAQIEYKYIIQFKSICDVHAKIDMLFQKQ